MALLHGERERDRVGNGGRIGTPPLIPYLSANLGQALFQPIGER